MGTLIQSKGVYKKIELEKGVSFDILSNAKKIKGINIINTNDNEPLYDNATFEVRIGRGIYIWEGTPVTLAQASVSVEPDKRFLTLAGEKELETSRTCFIRVSQPNTDAELVINLLLED